MKQIAESRCYSHVVRHIRKLSQKDWHFLYLWQRNKCHKRSLGDKTLRRTWIQRYWCLDWSMRGVHLDTPWWYRNLQTQHWTYSMNCYTALHLVHFDKLHTSSCVLECADNDNENLVRTKLCESVKMKNRICVNHFLKRLNLGSVIPCEQHDVHYCGLIWLASPATRTRLLSILFHRPVLPATRSEHGMACVVPQHHRHYYGPYSHGR